MGSLSNNTTVVGVTVTQSSNVANAIREPLLGNGDEENGQREQRSNNKAVHSRLVSLDLFRGLICMIMAW